MAVAESIVSDAGNALGDSDRGKRAPSKSIILDFGDAFGEDQVGDFLTVKNQLFIQVQGVGFVVRKFDVAPCSQVFDNDLFEMVVIKGVFSDRLDRFADDDRFKLVGYILKGSDSDAFHTISSIDIH